MESESQLVQSLSQIHGLIKEAEEAAQRIVRSAMPPRTHSQNAQNRQLQEVEIAMFIHFRLDAYLFHRDIEYTRVRTYINVLTSREVKSPVGDGDKTPVISTLIDDRLHEYDRLSRVSTEDQSLHALYARALWFMECAGQTARALDDMVGIRDPGTFRDEETLAEVSHKLEEEVFEPLFAGIEEHLEELRT